MLWPKVEKKLKFCYFLAAILEMAAILKIKNCEFSILSDYCVSCEDFKPYILSVSFFVQMLWPKVEKSEISPLPPPKVEKYKIA